jgi:hypothetical protein
MNARSFLEVTPDDHPDITWLEGARDSVHGHTLDVSIFDDHAKRLVESNIKVGNEMQYFY